MRYGNIKFFVKEIYRCLNGQIHFYVKFVIGQFAIKNDLILFRVFSQLYAFNAIRCLKHNFVTDLLSYV